MVVVIDYGMGNLRSVQKALYFLKAKAVVSGSPRVIKKADRIILPGVGNFGMAVKELEKRGIFSLIKASIGEGTLFLGICLGMQLLFKTSEEAPGVSGFDIIEGAVKKFPAGKPIPHMGWNSIYKSAKNRRLSFLKSIKNGSFFYFAHSYYCAPENKDTILTRTNYGLEFPSSLHKDNVWAVQFHPEKSQELGLKLLNNFLSL